MTGPEGAALDPPCTIEAGGAIYPMVGVGNRPGLAVFDAAEQLCCLYLLGDDGVYHIDWCDRCLPGERGERIDVHTPRTAAVRARLMAADPSEFLLARIAEDEEAARAAVDAVELHRVQPWRYHDDEEVVYVGDLDPDGLPAASDEICHAIYEDCGPHIARHDPARVLADCAAKRAIVEMHGREHRCPNHLEWWEEPCATLRILAQPYADHPDFDPAWQ